MDRWEDILKAARAPADESYAASVTNRMATSPEALTTRDNSIIGAWTALGVNAEHATNAMKRGSGAVAWLLKNGELPEPSQTTSNGELPPPPLPSQTTSTSVLLDQIGNTPLLHLKKLSTFYGITLLGKAEFSNPGGSVKDRAALSLLNHFETTKQLLPGGTVVEGTGGNTGVALAMLCAARGYKCILTMPTTVAQEKISTMEAFGATVELCATSHTVNEPGHYTQRAATIAASLPNAVHTNQFLNTANKQAHETTTGPEILRQALSVHDALSGFACAAGTGGTIAGIASFLAAASPATTVTLVDCDGSSLGNYLTKGEFSKAPGDTLTEGIGIGRLTANFAAGRQHIHNSLPVTDSEAFKMAFALAQSEGVFVGPSAALNVAGAVKLGLYLKEQGIPNPVVATILCDSGSSYLSKCYSKQWRTSNNIPEYSGNLADVLDPSPPPTPQAAAHLFASHTGGS